MKKIRNRFHKTQWRITVPNINTSLFKKVILINAMEENKVDNRKSGSYDFREAQKEFDKSRSLPNSLYVNSEINSDSDSESSYKDARMDLSKNEDAELYADINVKNQPDVAEISNTEQYEYDVPKISFSFFDKNKNRRQSNPVLIKSEVKIVLAAPDNCDSSLSDENDGNFIKSESIEVLPVVGMIRCGSDPNIIIQNNDSDDGLYKIPRQLTRRCRLSQSLSEFNVKDFEDIEHISCSQTIKQVDNDKNEIAESAQNLEYCKARSRLPMKLRRLTFLKRPKRALDTFNNFKEKFNNMITEHASQQRVGAFDNKDKVLLNIEDVYNNSKTRCKSMLKNTSRLFRKSPSVGDSSKEVSVPLTPSDIVYKLNYSDAEPDLNNAENDDFATIKSVFRKSKYVAEEGQNGFEDLRRYVKQGGDFSKDVATILQERAEAESQYAKNLSKLSTKLSRACRDGVGGLNEAWKAVAAELEARAEIHRLLGQSILEETAKPLRNIADNHHRTRKQCENAVDKAAKSLSDWRAAEAKSKKQSHTCARDNEKLQDAAILDNSRTGKLTLSRSTSLIQLAHNMHNKPNSDKENTKLEGKKRKAEDAVKKADIEYYTLCVRAERARLEWESAVLRGVNTFQILEEERLNNLKTVLNAYLQHENELGPRLFEAVDKLKFPVNEAEACKDLSTFVNLRHSSQQVSEQLLPDFYCEHITLAMNRERRKQALIKLLHLIRQDIERERKSKNGLENLSKAIKQTPNFGAEDSQQSVTEKLYHMKSMLTYLEGARYKVHNALAELDSKPKSGHPLAPHITITRDKSGLQQSVLKVPQWLREEWFECDKSPVSEKSLRSNNSDPHDPMWVDRGAADGNSNQHDSDFDEFSSQCSSADNICSTEENPVQPIAKCKALYAYTPNLTDELALQPGDLLSVYRKQDDGWWLGECKGNVGIFPATYVELINSSNNK